MSSEGGADGGPRGDICSRDRRLRLGRRRGRDADGHGGDAGCHPVSIAVGQQSAGLRDYVESSRRKINRISSCYNPMYYVR